MHITQILFSGLGGHGAVFQALATQFALNGHRNSALFYGHEELRPDLRSWCDQRSMRWASVQKRPGLDMVAYCRLMARLNEFRPDLILMHGPAAWPAVVIHGLLYHCPHYLRDTQVHHSKRPVEKLLTWLTTLSARGLIFLSPLAYRQTLGALRLIMWPRCRVIPNGVDLQKFSPRDRPFSAQAGMLSRINAGKDHRSLITALGRASGWTLALAGQGPEQARLEELVRNLDLDSRVDWRGQLDFSEVPNFLGELDVYCHATWGEAMSTSVLQAMAMGLPIVASDVDGVNNLLRDNESGCLVAPGDPLELAQALERLGKEPQLRKRLGDRARRQACEDYGEQLQSRRYLKFFGERPGFLREARRLAGRVRRWLGERFEVRICSHQGPSKKVPAPTGSYLADPFLAFEKSGRWLFVEEYQYAQGKGRIRWIDLLEPGRQGVALERPFHLSFPFLFHHQGKWFLMPESAQKGSLDLYRADYLPGPWKFEQTLIDGVAALDSILQFHLQRWWLITYLDGYLQLFSRAELLRGEWESHPINEAQLHKGRPFDSGRGAGPLFEHQGSWVRPAQHNQDYYGQGLEYWALVEWTRESYREELASLPDLPRSGHHWHQEQNWGVWDQRTRW